MICFFRIAYVKILNIKEEQLSEKELLELISNYKNKSNINEKISPSSVRNIEELKNVFNHQVVFDNLFAYKEAIDYILVHLIDAKYMDKTIIQEQLLKLNQLMIEVLEEKIKEHYWYDEHGLARIGLSKLQNRIKDICDESKYFLIHLPHYGTRIPDEYKEDYYLDEEELEKNIFEYADYDTFYLYNKLYNTFGGVVNPYSRSFFDPERFFDDEQESMQVKHSLGWFYENAILEKKPLRDTKNKDKIAEYYHKHHNELNLKTAQKLRLYGRCTIIDCHSFSNTRYWFHDKNLALPDICIGYDEFHKDEFLVKTLEDAFKDYEVGVNTPYAGSLVPTDFYNKDERVKSVMIEINKKLYLKPNTIERSEGVDIIMDKIKSIRDTLSSSVST